MISNEDAKQKVDDLIEGNMHDFTTWEIEFLDGMTDKTEFTDDQLEKIEEIWEKHK